MMLLFKISRREEDMRKYLFLAIFILVTSLVMSCAPVTITKCIEEYRYDGDKIKSKYKECVTQTPEKMPPIHLKHQELVQ
jgi:hypothetical protein